MAFRSTKRSLISRMKCCGLQDPPLPPSPNGSILESPSTIQLKNILFFSILKPLNSPISSARLASLYPIKPPLVIGIFPYESHIKHPNPTSPRFPKEAPSKFILTFPSGGGVPSTTSAWAINVQSLTKILHQRFYQEKPLVLCNQDHPLRSKKRPRV